MVGTNSKIGLDSYLAVFQETTFGTFPATAETGATTLEPLSIGFVTEIVNQKLEQISGRRGFTKRVQLDKNVAGTLEQNLHSEESVLLIAACMGGGIATSSLTGAFQHVISAGSFDTAPISLSFLERKGDTHFWQYSGGRVNTLTIGANVGELVKASFEFIFKDSTQSGADISSSLSISSIIPLTFVGGTFQYAGTEASLTSTAVEQIIGFELSINNNLVSDANARALGSNLLQVLPATMRNIELTTTQRFDTTTAWDRFIQATQGAIKLQLRGDSITSEHFHQIDIVLPKVFVNKADTEISSPNDVLMLEIPWDVVIDDPSTTTGKDIEITINNQTASY